ncbi:MAG TPA: tetratricopeptide repeat protein [Polyangiaceae bacterium]|nr:tetratricopeptide repeat protein [Polyangiaceae bacterium]
MGAVLATFSALLLSLAAPAAAQTDDNTAARLDFERGYARVEAGDYEGAIEYFERAYRARPHFSVLYNLGQAYAASGRVVAAVDTLERYLRDGRDAIPPERRERVAEAIEFHSRRIGRLELDVQPPSAVVFVDGQRIGGAPLPSPIRLAAGAHVVSVELERHAPLLRQVQVQGGVEQRLELALVPERDSEFAVTCRVPGAELEVDARKLTLSNGVEQLWLPAGPQRFRFSRPGYVTREVMMSGALERRTELDCALRVDSSHPDNATLVVRHPAGSRVWLDGEPFADGSVPPGQHEIDIAGLDRQSQRWIVQLAPRERRTLHLDPRPSFAERERAEKEAAERRRTIAYVLSGVGVAFGSVATALYVADNAEHAAWKRENADFIAQLRGNPADPALPQKLDALLEHENDIRARDTFAASLGVLGGAALIGAAVFAFWPEEVRPDMVVAGSHDVTLRLRF